MPQLIKMHKYEDFVKYTNNFKILYYSGPILAIMDIDEEFFVDVFCKSIDDQEDKQLKLKQFNLFIKNLQNRFNNQRDFQKFWIRAALYRPDETVTCLRFRITINNYIAMAPKYFGLLEQIDHMLFDFIKDNDFKVLSYKDDAHFIEKLSLERTFDPRNPDPNYIFFLKEGEEPYCKFE